MEKEGNEENNERIRVGNEPSGRGSQRSLSEGTIGGESRLLVNKSICEEATTDGYDYDDVRALAWKQCEAFFFLFFFFLLLLATA